MVAPSRKCPGPMKIAGKTVYADLPEGHRKTKARCRIKVLGYTKKGRLIFSITSSESFSISR